MNFLYKSIPSCTPRTSPRSRGRRPAASATSARARLDRDRPRVRNDNIAFGEDVQRGYKQTAVFASVDFDMIPKVLTLTGGTRYYHYSEYESGSEYTTR